MGTVAYCSLCREYHDLQTDCPKKERKVTETKGLAAPVSARPPRQVDHPAAAVVGEPCPRCEQLRLMNVERVRRWREKQHGG
jgi:hypothetical protein